MLSAAARTQPFRKDVSLLHHGICRQYWPTAALSPVTVDSRIKSCGRGPTSTCLFSLTSQLQHTNESTRLFASRSFPQTGEPLCYNALHMYMARWWPAFAFRFSRRCGLVDLSETICGDLQLKHVLYLPSWSLLDLLGDKQQSHFSFTQADRAADVEELNR